MSVDRFQLETAPRQIDAMEVDLQEGVPPALVSDLAIEVTRLLIKNGIDPNTAYYRGSLDGDADELTAEAKRIREVETWAEEYEEPQTADPYDEILLEKEQRKQANEAALFRQLDGDPNPQYTLGRYDTLFSDDRLTNPIHIAGVSSASYLDVYDGAMIDGMDPGQDEFVNKVVEIPEGQLALAAVARIHLRYDIINEDVEY